MAWSGMRSGPTSTRRLHFGKIWVLMVRELGSGHRGLDVLCFNILNDTLKRREIIRSA